jgi:hypothetical protein
MFPPNNLEALAENRRQDFEREVRQQQLLVTLRRSREPNRRLWRGRTARLLLWCGARLTIWGDRLAAGTQQSYPGPKLPLMRVHGRVRAG